MHLKLHSRRQILSITISTIHATTIFVVENAVLSLQLQEPSHRPLFLQQFRTAINKITQLMINVEIKKDDTDKDIIEKLKCNNNKITLP